MAAELIVGEPTATIEAWTFPAPGSAKRIVPATLLVVKHTGTIETLRFWNLEAATGAGTAILLGVYADKEGKEPTGAALAEKEGKPAVTTPKIWIELSGFTLKVEKNVNLWIAVLSPESLVLKPATKVNSAGLLVVKNGVSVANMKGAAETWTESSKKGPVGFQALGTVEEEAAPAPIESMLV